MTDDPHLWLEDLHGAAALDWVHARNAEATAALTGGERFAAIEREVREVLDADTRIPLPTWHAGRLFNLWRDAAHPRGLWRRTTLESYRSGAPEWEVLLDLDALAEAEDERWVWHGVDVLEPDGDRALLALSRGGSDASVVREFDLRTKAFVPDGFELAEAKSSVAWIDRDRILAATDVGAGSLTTSGYSRTVVEWRRGTALTEATTLYAGEADDMLVWAQHDPTPRHERTLVRRHVDFYRVEHHLRAGDGSDGAPLVRIPVPDDASVDLHRDWIIVRLRSAWLGHPAGTLLGGRVEDVLARRDRFEVVHAPDEHTALSTAAWTRGHLLVGVLHDVAAAFEVVTPGDRAWTHHPIEAAADRFASVDLVATDPDRSDGFFVQSTGYLEPPTLRYGEAAATAVQPEPVRHAPAMFPTDGLQVEQRFATSDDGTRVPYFVVGPERRHGPGPTLLTAYGGFEVPYLPAYSGSVGRAWLARGGTYVVANIRGGGEYGPRWHDAARGRSRLRAYEDFAAVARHLTETGTTTPAQLGIEGGSNGGLLVGVALTRFPELVGAVVCSVPLLDMRRYHLLLAGASWMAEYGDPDDPDDWAALREYSPYHNVRSGQAYPPVLFLTSTRDDRVHAGHARKMAARMLELGADVTFHENVEGGHGAAADNEQLARKTAMTFEFLWRHLGGERSSAG